MIKPTRARRAILAASISAALPAAPLVAGQILRVDIKSDNINSTSLAPDGGSPNSGYGFPPEGGSLGANTDSTIGPASTPAFESWQIDGGLEIDLGTGTIINDPRLNRFDFTSTVRPNLTAYAQASGSNVINSASQFGMVPNASAAGPYYFNEVYRDYLVVSPPLVGTENPTLTLNIRDTAGTDLLPNTPYNVTVFSYVKPYDATGNNETSVNNSVYGNNTFHFVDNTAGGMGSNSDSYQFVRPVPAPGPSGFTNSNPDTPVGGILDNYTWAMTMTVFTDANSQFQLTQSAIREQSLPNDPQRFQLDFPVISGFEVNNDVVNYTGASGGNWNTHSNWAAGPNGAAPAAPNAMSAIANFFSGGNQSVVLDAPVVVGNLNFNAPSATGTTISNAAAHTITLDSSKGPNASVAIASRSGSHTVNAAVLIKDRSSSYVATGSSVIFTGDLTAATTTVTERVTNTVIDANLVLRFDKVGGGTLGFRSVNGIPQIRVFGGRLKTTGGVSVVPNLTVNTGATLDLAGTSSWVVDYTDPSPLATLQGLVTTGRNGGTWDGPGITSSRAASDSRLAIGMGEAAALGVTTFPGTSVPVDATAVLFRVTLTGDSNLDGIVNISDFSTVAAKFNQSGSWIDGDSNYDGVINISDFSLLASNFNQVLSAELPREATVPEPVATALMAAFGLITARRRR